MLDVGPSPLGNLLLCQLPEDEFRRLHPFISTVQLVPNQILYDRGGPIEHAYFPLSGMVSLVTGQPLDAAGVEVGTIGREGVVGVAVLFDPEPISFVRHIVQLPGSALRIPGPALVRQAANLPTLRQLCFRYVQAALAQAAQNAACNVTHTVPQRTAKWILLAQDRVEGAEVTLKHEFLANMLGVRRPSVTLAVGALQAAEIIQISRGRIRVLDRPRLEASACGCYGTMADEFRRLLQSGARGDRSETVPNTR